MDTYHFDNDEERLDYLKSLVAVLPEQPGIYQYFDKLGKIIYIGKAKNLKRRVSSYFLKKQNGKTKVLVLKICHIHHIVVNTEEDALLLENNLIKKHKPHYNILLKDDKTYPWIAVLDEPFPRVILTRRHLRGKSLYFGPYPNHLQIKELLDIIKHNYPLRQCNLNLSPERIKRGCYKVCLKYHIKLCLGPCEGLISEDDYGLYIDSVKSLLKGNISALIRQLKSEMEFAADTLEFEKAEALKERIDRLSKYKSRSLVSSNKLINCDVFSLVRDEERKRCYVNFMRVNDGQVLSSYTMTFRCVLDEPDEEFLSFGIYSVRETSGLLQREVIVPLKPDSEFINTTFVVPRVGEKKQLLELSEKNARLYKLEQLKKEAIRSKAAYEERLLLQLREFLALDIVPRHIEIFDNSNIQGACAVAACVVYRDCKPCRSEYRLFNIKSVAGADDYASMYEVVYRRYSRLIAEGSSLPDLVVADGGEGQMEVIRRALSDLSLSIQIIGLPKDSHHRTNQILFGFPPKIIGICKTDAVFRFFTRMQDEVHRVAISFHRNKRSKNMVASELDSIVGIGSKTKEQLFKSFKSIDSIRIAAIEELTNCIGKGKARIVYGHFHKDEGFKL